MKFVSFKYDHSANLGDQIQSFAAEQYLPSVDEQVNRDSLDTLSGPEKRFVIMNGWFSRFPENWPPSEALEPLFFGFHMSTFRGAKDRFLEPDSLAYFKQFEPIGCRDRQTRDWLRERGVDAYYSKCLTLTFPKRRVAPKDGKIFLVDVQRFYPLPKHIRKKGLTVNQGCSDLYGDEVKRSMAKRLLELYEKEAALVVTSRLHCAMPCLAMGIPVVYLGNPDDYRTSILKDVGLPIHKYAVPKSKPLALLKRLVYETFSLGVVKQAIWNPPVLDIEEVKEEVRSTLLNELSKRLPPESKVVPQNVSVANTYASF